MAVHDLRSQRLFIDIHLEPGAKHACDKNQSNYLRNVLRLTEGNEILVFNGNQGEWIASLEMRGKRDCELIIVDQVRAQSKGPDITYLFAPLKHARLDYMVQKATEMGVAVLQPVLTKHTVASRVNVERMRANTIEAAEQCGILRIPEVQAPIRLGDALAGLPANRVLIFADEAAEHASPLEALSGVERGAPIAVLIGPEGGFADKEREMIQAQQNVRTLSLGPRIMRADTAAVALLALVNAVVGDWSA